MYLHVLAALYSADDVQYLSHFLKRDDVQYLSHFLKRQLSGGLRLSDLFSTVAKHREDR
jgi:hypothetical protein